MDAIVNLLRKVYGDIEGYELILKDRGEILYEDSHVYMIVELILGILINENEQE